MLQARLPLLSMPERLFPLMKEYLAMAGIASYTFEAQPRHLP
jgi:hypothetical protein